MSTPDTKKPAAPQKKIEAKGGKKEQIKAGKEKLKDKTKKVEATAEKKGGWGKIGENLPPYSSGAAIFLLGIFTGALPFLLIGGLFGLAEWDSKSNAKKAA
jgi:hypothetical protein